MYDYEESHIMDYIKLGVMQTSSVTRGIYVQ
jgi:hypothetical protein